MKTNYNYSSIAKYGLPEGDSTSINQTFAGFADSVIEPMLKDISTLGELMVYPTLDDAVVFTFNYTNLNGVSPVDDMYFSVTVPEMCDLAIERVYDVHSYMNSDGYDKKAVSDELTKLSDAFLFAANRLKAELEKVK